MATKQLNKQQALDFYNSKVWEDMTNEQLVKFQLFQELLCIPFSLFHEAVEKVLERPVFNTEFANPDKLRAEYLGESPAPTLDEILGQLPKEKLLLIIKTDE